MRAIDCAAFPPSLQYDNNLYRAISRPPRPYLGFEGAGDGTAPTPLPGRSPPQSDLCDRSSLLASYQEGVRAIAPDTFSMKFSFTHGSKFVVE